MRAGPSLTFGAAFDSGANKINALRLTCALIVLWSHSYPLTGNKASEPVLLFLGGYGTGGEISVLVFFVISGFLISRSIEGHDLTSYLVSRVLRILPALAVVILIQTIVIGPLVTTMTVTAYFRDPGFMKGLQELLIFNMNFRLPGVFSENPYPLIVNGSLWTLPAECAFYIVMPFLYLFGFLGRRTISLTTAALALLLQRCMLLGYSSTNFGGFLFKGVPAFVGLDWAVFFITGAALWKLRYEIPMSGGMAVICLCSLFCSAGTLTAQWALHLAVPYLTLYLALASPPLGRWLDRIGDLSYGVYIYAFLVQQTLMAAWGGAMKPTVLTLAALPVTLACAWVSWRTIESPALGLKRMLAGPTLA